MRWPDILPSRVEITPLIPTRAVVPLMGTLTIVIAVVMKVPLAMLLVAVPRVLMTGLELARW